ncbi:MAG: hypothetical protein MJY60_00015 [Bacteroidales bacterium]|nr:hypothetical protein [Bacteroidales bacterium]
MDIGSFSKYIKGLIVDYDKVEVPGLGIFYAKLMPARYSDNRTTIYPPYRTVFFRMEDVTPDGGRMLYENVSDVMGVPMDQAETEVDWCVSRLKSQLEGNRCCNLPGLGQMVSNSVNELFFVPVEDLDIFPDGMGLEPVCVKINESRLKGRHQRRKEARAAAAAAAAVAPRVKEQPRRKERKREVRPGRVVLWTILGILLLAILFLIAVYVFRDSLAPLSYNIIEAIDDMLNKMLYTAEERALLGF